MMSLDVVSKNGTVLRKAGDNYDAHHTGIHGAGSQANRLFK